MKESGQSKKIKQKSAPENLYFVHLRNLWSFLPMFYFWNGERVQCFVANKCWESRSLLKSCFLIRLAILGVNTKFTRYQGLFLFFGVSNL